MSVPTLAKATGSMFLSGTHLRIGFNSVSMVRTNDVACTT